MIDFKTFMGDDILEDTAVSTVVDSKSTEELNSVLFTRLDKNFLSPEAGFECVRNILSIYGFDIPPMFDLDREGDEVVLDLTSYGGAILYVLYSLSDEGYYEFYAEVTDEAGVEKLLSDGVEDEDL